MIIEKDKWDNERGSGFWNFMKGDHVFLTLKAAGKGAKPGVVGITKETVSIIGGTRKCSGIEGSFEFTRFALPSAGIEGIVQNHVRVNIKFKLPQNQYLD